MTTTSKDQKNYRLTVLAIRFIAREVAKRGIPESAMLEIIIREWADYRDLSLVVSK